MRCSDLARPCSAGFVADVVPNVGPDCKSGAPCGKAEPRFGPDGKAGPCNDVGGELEVSPLFEFWAIAGEIIAAAVAKRIKV